MKSDALVGCLSVLIMAAISFVAGWNVCYRQCHPSGVWHAEIGTIQAPAGYARDDTVAIHLIASYVRATAFVNSASERLVIIEPNTKGVGK